MASLRAVLKCDRCSSAFFARLLCTSPPDDNDGRDNNEDDAARDDRKDGCARLRALEEHLPSERKWPAAHDTQAPSRADVHASTAEKGTLLLSMM